MTNKNLTLREMALRDIPAAFELFLNGFARERAFVPMLPSEPGRMDKLKELMEQFLGNETFPGFMVEKEGKPVGFMLTAYTFDFKGQKAVMVPEFCHGALGSGGERRRIYQMLYQKCAQMWMDKGRQLHLIGFPAHDSSLRDILFDLGYGAIIAERIRDLSDITGRDTSGILRCNEAEDLLELQREHMAFYPLAPVFIHKDTGREENLKRLEEHLERGDAIFSFPRKGRPAGYMIVGKSEEDGEGFLLGETNTAQVKSAFIRPDMRGQGGGELLLQKAVEWAREQGYDRLFVEHETANMYGGNFWANHFEAYVYFAMRYMEKC